MEATCVQLNIVLAEGGCTHRSPAVVPCFRRLSFRQGECEWEVGPRVSKAESHPELRRRDIKKIKAGYRRDGGMRCNNGGRVEVGNGRLNRLKGRG
jgi:hypothetical protein